MFQAPKNASKQEIIGALMTHLTESILASLGGQQAFNTISDDGLRKALVDGCRATAEALFAPKPVEPAPSGHVAQLEAMLAGIRLAQTGKLAGKTVTGSFDPKVGLKGRWFMKAGSAVFGADEMHEVVRLFTSHVAALPKPEASPPSRVEVDIVGAVRAMHLAESNYNERVEIKLERRTAGGWSASCEDVPLWSRGDTSAEALDGLRKNAVEHLRSCIEHKREALALAEAAAPVAE